MIKFKVGDKVVVLEDSKWGLVGTEGVIIEAYENTCRYKITGGNLNDFNVVIGYTWTLLCSEFKLISETKNKDQKQPSTTPLCYAEEQEKIQEELTGKQEEIENIFSPEVFDGQVVFSEGEFNIDGVFDITQAKALKKWLNKMTATPKKKVVNKVTKKKPSKKKDLLKLSKK